MEWKGGFFFNFFFKGGGRGEGEGKRIRWDVSMVVVTYFQSLRKPLGIDLKCPFPKSSSGPLPHVPQLKFPSPRPPTSFSTLQILPLPSSLHPILSESSILPTHLVPYPLSTQDPLPILRLLRAENPGERRGQAGRREDSGLICRREGGRRNRGMRMWRDDTCKL